MVSGKLGRLTRRSSLGNERPTLLSLFGKSLGDNLLVGSSLFLVSEDGGHLFCLAMTLALQHKRCHKTLDLGSFASLDTLLAGKGTRNNVLADIIILGQVEQLADVVGSLGTQTTGDSVVGQSWDLLLSLLGDNQVKDGDVVSNNATSDGLALTLTSTTRAVRLVSLLTQDAHSGVGQDTLTHGETLLVVSSGDTKDVSFEFLSQDASVDLLGHTALIEVLETLFVIDLEDLLHSRAGAGNIKLQVQKGGDKEG